MRPNSNVVFPRGKRLAVTLHFPVEWWTEPDEDYQMNYHREYGARVGAWRLLDVFDRAGIKATCHLGGIVAELFPDLAREIVGRGHDVAGHGYDQSHPQYKVGPDEERAIVQKTLTTIEQVTGHRPRGWVATQRQLTKDTVRILAEEGLLWHSNHDLSDLPSAVEVGSKIIIDCPIQRYVNYSERRFIGWEGSQIKSCREVLDFFKSQIEALRGAAVHEPLCFQFGSHAHMFGLAPYSWVVGEMLDYIKSFPDVWFVTTTELAQYWLENNVKK